MCLMCFKKVHLRFYKKALFLEVLLMSSYVKRIEVFYRFSVIPDLDDNKFVDCAFASNAHFIVSDDRGFAVLDILTFPKVARMRLEAFSVLLEKAF